MYKWLMKLLRTEERVKESNVVVFPWVCNGRELLVISGLCDDSLIVEVKAFTNKRGEVTEESLIQEALFFNNAIHISYPPPNNPSIKEMLIDKINKMNNEEFISSFLEFIETESMKK